MFRYRLIRIAMNIARLILLIHFKVSGRENIPSQGPYIVVLNHTSVVDTPVLLINFPLQKWRFFAVNKWRTHPIYGPIMAWLGAIYIERDTVDRSQLRAALDALEAGTVFGLAPEGSRSFTGQMMAAKDGAAYLASRTRVPILPVGLVNNDVLFANVKRLKPTTIELHIGRPFNLPDLGRRVRGTDLPAFTHYIMVHIAAQLPERYHGYYADSPALAALLRSEDAWPYCAEF
ncbi:MAG: 1-acyl-sn-glycerol-3-phosphate acyltransferase [Ardenticatenaceae bacterium]|nr:1-acyl-sn-glycerol-3-phosphate acyltransferase [Ardenticatenaceae bacterium]MCB9445717.1 1-acyl-sn-glycerol-3-phosphate acyltransferase [Ardenticatenaceae bacterium]